MIRSLFFLLLPALACAQQPLLDSGNIVAPGATLRLVSHAFTFTEGASTDQHGNIFFTDQPNNKIWEYDTEMAD